MKNVVFGLLLLTLGQSYSQLLWNKNFSFETADEFQDVQPFDDCGFILVGNTAYIDDTISDIQIRLTKLDEKGNLVWNKKYKLSEQSSVFGVQKLFKVGHNYIILGQGEKVITLNSADDIYWLKVNSDGKKIFLKSNPKDTASRIADRIVGASQLKSGDIIWLQEKNDLDANSANAYKLYYNRINPEGELIESKFVDMDYSTNFYFKSIALTPEEEIMILGFSRNYEGKALLCLIKLDHNGNLIWRKIYNDDFRGMAYDIAYWNNGHFLMVASTRQITAGIKVFEIDSNGEILHSNYITHFLSQVYSWPITEIKIIPQKDNFIVATECYSHYLGCPPPWPVDYTYYTFNNNCDSLSLDTIPHEGNDYVINAKKIDDERIMIIGGGGGSYAALLGKTLRTCLTYSTEINENNVKIFPNPVTNNEFNLINISNQNATLILYDQLGRVIRRWTNKSTYSTEGIQNGIYYWKLINNKNNSISGKIVVAH